MEHDTFDLSACARLLDARLHDTLTTPFRLPRGRLYGCTDAGDELRLSFLGDHRDVYALIDGPIAVLARQFDAAAVAVTGWAAPMAPADAAPAQRPSEHPERHRIRVCCAVGDAGIVAVMRSEHDPDTILEMPGPGEGAMPHALLRMWAGLPVGAGPDRARPSSTSRSALRHRRTA